MATPRKSPAKKVAKKAAAAKKSNLIFPAGRIRTMLKKGQFARRVSMSSGVYMAAVLEYLTAELLELSAAALKGQKKDQKRITPRTITLAVRNDDSLGMLLKDVTVSRGGVLPTSTKALSKKAGKKASATPSA